MVTEARVSRLRHAVVQHAGIQPASARPSVPSGERPPIDVIFRGDWHETPFGPVFVRDEWFPLDHRHGSRALHAALRAPADALAHLLHADVAPDPSRLAFFDIETTGLSSGTGTWIILAGLGSYEPDGFRMRQYFLADIAYERAMLTMLSDDLARFDGLVTYNGRAFDMPFVKSRMTLTRTRYPCAHLPHFDLLHAVRRLFRHRMPGCRLTDAERQLLRIVRSDDVDGALIPGLYFDYVRAGRAAPLRGVFRHNAEDVLSLVGVLAACAHLLSTDDLDPDDAIAAARWWEIVGETGRARALYRKALPWLDGGDDWPWVASRHARLCKRAGDRAEALPLWQALWASGDRAAGIELAMHYEHRRPRDLAAARATASQLLASAPPAEAGPLAARLARIESKQARSPR